MTSYRMLSELAQAFFALLALLNCGAGIVGIGYAVFQKRIGAVVRALASFVLSYIQWQTACALQPVHKVNGLSAAFRYLDALPWLCWLIVSSAFTAMTLLSLVLSFRNARMRVTPVAIKLCADRMPNGICYWRDGGRVIFSNDCANRLSIALTGQPLMNGSVFRDAISQSVMHVEGRYWRFACRDIVFEGMPLHEMIASDITEMYAKTRALERDMEELSRLNQEQQIYQFNIDDDVRRREILQARINIHDEMNRLMLYTMSVDGRDADALDRVFSMWERNALLLCMEAEEKTDKNAVKRLEQIAGALGIRLIWRSALPPSLTEKQRDLFYTAAQEAITNASKHAGAEKMEISFAVTADAICCNFKNDGCMPQGEMRFAGGLANLAYLADEQNAHLSAKAGDRFELTLRFAK